MGNERGKPGNEDGYGAKPDVPVDAAPDASAGPPTDAGEAWSFRNPQEQRNHDQDPAYESWRDAQMESFDRDYEEYQRQNPAGLRAGFAEWRQTREKQGR
jgi:hypothetical protein